MRLFVDTATLGKGADIGIKMTPPAPYDVVELVAPWRSWPEGTIGTVVDEFDGGALLEIADADGQTLDLIEVPLDRLRPAGGTAEMRHAAPA